MSQYSSKVEGLSEKMLKADMIAKIEAATAGTTKEAPKKAVSGRNEK